MVDNQLNQPSRDYAKDAKEREDKARAEIKKNAEARNKMVEESGSTQVKPTPTQEENDLAKSGVYLAEHEPDGSPEQHPMPELNPTTQTRQVEAKPGSGGYATRQAAGQTKPTP